MCLGLFPSCTSIPSNYSAVPRGPEELGFRIGVEQDNAFELFIFYHSYSFMPDASDEIQEAVNHFRTTAEWVANEKERLTVPILESLLTVSTTRNIIDGHNSVYVSGLVEMSQAEGR